MHAKIFGRSARQDSRTRGTLVRGDYYSRRHRAKVQSNHSRRGAAPSWPDAYMIRPGVGFIDMTPRFTTTRSMVCKRRSNFCMPCMTSVVLIA